VSWQISGTYFESCNCDAICPCRRVGGVAIGRSTHGVCIGALSWLVEEGHDDGVDLAGLAAVLVFDYDDDEEGSPWQLLLHVDARGDDAQREALAEILLGRRGGEHVLELPWVRKPCRSQSVVSSRIEVDHTPQRQWFRVRDEVVVRAAGPVETDQTVTCIVPGHDRPGTELHVESLRVEEAPFSFSFTGVCGFSTGFSYQGP
jgi:hypothetical protein